MLIIFGETRIDATALLVAVLFAAQQRWLCGAHDSRVTRLLRGGPVQRQRRDVDVALATARGPSCRSDSPSTDSMVALLSQRHPQR
jgi:hypothetical protein